MSMPGMASPFGSGIFIDAIFAQQGHPPAASADWPGADYGAAVAGLPHIIPSLAGADWDMPGAAACSIMPHPAAAAGKVPIAVNAAAANTRFLMRMPSRSGRATMTTIVGMRQRPR